MCIRDRYRELEAFAQFASDLDEASKNQLDHGVRVTELTKQDQYSPMTVAEMGLVLYAANEGYLADIEVEKIKESMKPKSVEDFNKLISELKIKVKETSKKLIFLNSNKKRHNIFGLWSINLMKTLENDIIKNKYRRFFND